MLLIRPFTRLFCVQFRWSGILISKSKLTSAAAEKDFVRLGWQLLLRRAAWEEVFVKKKWAKSLQEGLSNLLVDKGLFRWIRLHFGSLLFSPVEGPQMREEWENVCLILQWISWRFTSKVFVSRVPVALFTFSSPISNNDNNSHDDYCHHYIIGSVHAPLTYLLPVGFLQLGKKRSHKPENCWKRYEVWLWI